MSEILTAETMASWRQRHLDHGLAISTYTCIIDSHEALREQMERLELVAAAAQNLRDLMTSTYRSPEYIAVWATSQQLRGPYTGPMWTYAQTLLDEALTALEASDE